MFCWGERERERYRKTERQRGNERQRARETHIHTCVYVERKRNNEWDVGSSYQMLLARDSISTYVTIYHIYIYKYIYIYIYICMTD